ncbi:hypothetical protein SAMN05660649_02871 [Desulfotomaculum arcticum]|uniref:Uncharacterized protein n=1 Tax=Desulfotruncus arcticus DSM 17038 TaxID=1121424 RepID=A0A1I2V2S2_9FIRM|nr:hypothetical protein [Desulfotruncus arcticus]SFG83628.1 hypothetical protein SAMN05660649_02871 [Desulfotomaculum arcticum] [Desulfotruncus arcticus DSM 17038]
MQREKTDLGKAARTLGGAAIALLANNVGVKAFGAALAASELWGDAKKTRRTKYKSQRKYRH